MLRPAPLLLLPTRHCSRRLTGSQLSSGQLFVLRRKYFLILKGMILTK
jgi:hypothetical protein